MGSERGAWDAEVELDAVARRAVEDAPGDDGRRR
jgi:hypothetical protein